MADLSKLELTDSTLVTIKDNSQANSDHRHYEKDIVPLVHKTYESTSYYATATNMDTSSWYFASIKPDSWYLPWKVRFKIHSYCPNYPANESITHAMVTGRSDGIAYANWNELQTTAHYYTVWYPLKEAGFDAGYGHAFGVSIYGANNYNKQAYYRTFEIDFIECENCTVTILDNPVLWENWSGTGTTYYGTRATGNASSRGLQETGDNDTVTHNRIQYFAGTTGNKGIWANSLFMEDANSGYQNVCTAADGTVTTSNRTTATTKKANTNGFKVLGTIWYSNTAYNANTQISGSSVVYSAYGLADARYSFNVTLSTTALVPYSQLYLVGTIHSDGLFYLDDTWWSQTPNDTSKIYVLVGAVYDSTASNVRFTLYEQNKWYKYDGTQLIEITNDAQTVNGHTVNADVPSTAVFTDEKVTQTATSDNKKYEVLFSGTNDNTTRTEGTRKSSDLLFNPNKKELSLGNSAVSIQKETNTSDLPCGRISLFNTISDPPFEIGVETISLIGATGNIFATSLNGATIGNNPVFTDTTYSLTQDATDEHILTLTPSSGTAQSVTVPDTMVTQTLTSTDANYPILFAKTTISTTTVDNTNTARRNNNMYVNPSTGNLQVTQLNGVTVGDNPVFTDAKVTQNPLADNVKPLLLANSVSGSATTGQVYKQVNFTVNGSANSLNLNAVSDAPAELNIQGNINIDAVNEFSMLYAPDTTATFFDVGTETINGVTVGNSPEFTDTQSDWNASSGKAQILNKPTLGTASAKDVPTSGNASTTQVVMGNDTRLSDSRTPTSHTHGNIANGGTISSTAVTPASTDYLLISDTSNSGKVERGIAIGTDTTKYLRNDGTWDAPSGGSVGQIYYCETDSTSTTTLFTVTISGITALTDGLILCVKNTVGASASGCTLNLNGLGAKPIWLSEANAACTTEWKNNSTYLFVYDATNERWVIQTGRDTDVTGNNIIARYSKVVSGGNNVKKYSLFAMLPDGTYSSFTTNSGTSAKTFDSTNRFDIRKIFVYGGSSDRSTGDKLSASGWKLQGYDIDMRYSFNGVTTKDNTSSLTAEQPVYLVFDPTTESSGCYKLKSPYYTQTPNATGAIYVLVGVMRDCYRLDFWFYNPAFTYDGTKLVPFSNATFAGLIDTYISNPAPCDVLMYDGSDWVNTNKVALKDTNLHTTVSLDGDTGTIISANTPSTGGFTVNDVVVAGFTTGSGNYFKFSLPFANSATSASIISIDQTSAGTKVMLPNSTLQTNFIDVSNSSITSVTKDWITFEFKFTSTQTANTPCTVVLVNLTFELF